MFKTIVYKGVSVDMKMRKLPDAEFEIMRVIWQLKPPVTSGMLIQGLREETGREWKLQTVHTLLNRLVERGFLRFEKAAKEKTFFPTVARADYLAYETKSFMKQYHEGSLLNLVNTAYQGESLSDGDIEELVKWANDRREQP